MTLYHSNYLVQVHNIGIHHRLRAQSMHTSRHVLCNWFISIPWRDESTPCPLPPKINLACMLYYACVHAQRRDERGEMN